MLLLALVSLNLGSKPIVILKGLVLFEIVWQQVKSQVIKSEGEEFTFTKLTTCGLCEFGISADEKLKKLKKWNR